MKTIYFIRHAEAIHNPPVKKYGKSILIDEKYFDAELTEYGINQCYEVKDNFNSINLDIVFVSPLTRTLQTANILFQDIDIKIKGLEIIRERLGVRPCDKRTGLIQLKKIFTNINFDHCIDGDVDPLWTKTHRETEKELKARISKFLKWIQTRQEKKIGIVTHQGYMLRLYQILDLDFPAPQNCEVIKLNLKFPIIS